ncbi:MAG: nucleotidyltransferase family protein [Ignavibacteriales bacterium]|nr:nucleotidyltransferase family protein [Ignavibacteriales bacterium]
MIILKTAINGVNITHVVEKTPLGTAGSFKELESDLKERFMIFYGDVMLDMDLKSFIEFDKNYKSLATIVAHPNDHPYDSDLVEIDNNNKVIAFHSKPHPENFFYKNLVNAAVYILDSEIFKYIPENKSTDFGKDIFPELIRQNQTVIAYKSPEYIKDMGTTERLQKVEKDFLSGKIAGLNKNNPRQACFVDIQDIIDNKITPESIKEFNSGEVLLIAYDKAENQDLYKKIETELGKSRVYIDEIYSNMTLEQAILKAKRDFNVNKIQESL